MEQKDQVEQEEQRFNSKDLKIISALRKNARLHMTQISKNTSIPITTLYDRLKKFERDLIIKHTSIIDFKILGYCYNAGMIVRCEEGSALLNFMMLHPSTNSISKLESVHRDTFHASDVDVGSKSSYLVDAVFKSNIEFHAFLDLIKNDFGAEFPILFKFSHDLKKEEFCPGLN